MKKGKDYIGVGCGAFILNKNNELLLTKRNSNCRNKVGFWSIPGGGTELYETLKDGLKREVREEIGVEIEIEQLLCVTDDIIYEESQHWVAPQYKCNIISGTPKNLEPHKFEEIGWFPLNNLPDKLTNTTIDGVNILKNIIN